MSHQDVIFKLQLHLKALYQRAIDADQQLDVLAKQGMGKFSAIIKNKALFQCKSERFQPYVLEVAEQMQQLESKFDQDRLKHILLAMQELTALLEQFKTTLRRKSKEKAPQ